MEDLLDLLFELLAWLFPLLGKFWFLILGYLGYVLFGKQGQRKQERRPAPRPVLTPVNTGGWPWGPEEEERRTVTPLNRQEEIPDEPRPFEAWSSPEETEADVRRGKEEGFAVEPLEFPVEAPAVPKRTKESPGRKTVMDPREGMKWAIIYGAPRSRTSPLPSRRGL